MEWLSGWGKRVKLTIDNGDIDAALSNFPILLYISASSGRNSDDISCVFDELTADANRKKIAVTTTDGETECYVEIEKWDDANEKAWLWVKAPSISSSADTDFYLYYDVDHADNDTYVGDIDSTPGANVWDSNFKSVWHLGEGNANQIDSKGSNDFVKAGTLTDVEGRIGRGVSATFSLTNNLSKTSATDLPTDAQTISAWYKASTNPSTDYTPTIFRRGQSGVDSQGLTLISTKTNAYAESTYKVDTNWKTLTDNVDIADGSWHLVVATRTGANYKLYVDGVEEGSGADGDTGNLTIDKLYAGGGGNTSEVDYLGDAAIDEIRYSAIARSAAWIKASYETGRDDLLDWGSEELYAIPRHGFVNFQDPGIV